jgi:hypothetical protein
VEGAFLFGRNMWSRNNQASIERNQRKLDAGIMSKQYPEVASIVINMMYKQKGVANPIQRVVNFSPASHAFFRLDCLSRDCVDGGFDLTQIINSMIRNHSAIAYEVAIQYT